MCQSDAEGDWVSIEWRLVRARKNHACEACDSGIKKGQLYRVTRGIWEGYVWSGAKRCLRCDTIAIAMGKRGCDVDFDLGEMVGERVENEYPHVSYNEAICELPFLSQAELEARALKEAINV